MPNHFQSVDEYIAAQPKPVQPILAQVRQAIRQAVPEAQERISYNMPAYELKGSRLIWFAAWKKHYALYPATPELIAAFQKELAPYEVDKSTIRFPYTEPVPSKLIAKIARFRR